MGIDMAQVRRVERPKTFNYRNGLAAQLRETLTSGDALSLPIGDQAIGAARDRYRNNLNAVARAAGASLRTVESEDKLSVLIWLERKA